MGLKLAIGMVAAMLAACALAQAPEPKAAAAGTLLVGNKGEDTLSFIDLATGKELGRAETGPMPHEIAISPDGARAAVVAYGGNMIDIFDVLSRTRLRTIDLGENEGPHGLVWLDDGRLVATTERSGTLTIVDTNNGDDVTAISTGQRGHMVAVSPDKSRAYTANIPDGTVSVIDLVDRRKLGDVEVGGEPEGIALAKGGGELWVGDLEGARVQAFDTETLEKLAEVKTGPVPIRVAVSPDGRWVVTSNLGSGSLTVIDAATREKVRAIAVSGTEDAQQVTILFSDDGSRLYAAETGRNQVAEVDFMSGKVLRRLDVGTAGDGLAIAR